ELIEHSGFGTTATGATLPLSDVLDAAADAQPWLALFKDGAAQPMYFGRGRRLASRAQRLASFSGEGGERCSAPGCTQPAARTEMHHSDEDWADGGPTDLPNLAPACPQHHRMVGPDPGQYTTGTITTGKYTGRTWWQLNVAPGMPQNPRLINRLPDLPATFEKHLADVRTEIHGPPPDTGQHLGIVVVDDSRATPPHRADINFLSYRIETDAA
ncbi:MAG: HNH endonuclease, partial [Gordonia sp. (in: high G+C Gram-positive bacteria)]